MLFRLPRVPMQGFERSEDPVNQGPRPCCWGLRWEALVAVILVLQLHHTPCAANPQQQGQPGKVPAAGSAEGTSARQSHKLHSTQGHNSPCLTRLVRETPLWEQQAAYSAHLQCLDHYIRTNGHSQPNLLQLLPRLLGNTTNPAAGQAAADAVDGDGVSGPHTPHMLSRQQKEKGFTHLGSLERLRLAWSRAIAGQPVKVATIGGSISAGSGASDAPSWPDRLKSWLQTAQGANVTLHNGAMHSITSSYMATCLKLHVPVDADVVVVEFAVNDEPGPTPYMDNPARRGLERLLRRLLELPKRPAVVLLNAYSFQESQKAELSRTYYSNAEADFDVLAGYYNLPSLSVRGCCFQEMLANATGFQVHTMRQADMPGLKGKAFYWDKLHPDGNTGHRAMADLVVGLLQHVTHALHARPVALQDVLEAAGPLPDPMIHGNVASSSDKCLVGDSFKAVVKASAGWEWKDESNNPERPKWGFISTTKGSTLELQVDTTAGVADAAVNVTVSVSYLSSYEHMGRASVRCVRGCTCLGAELNGHWTNQASLLTLLEVQQVTQSKECVMSVTVQQQSDSGEHKVKIMAIMVSEDVSQHYTLGSSLQNVVNDVIG